MEDTFRLAMQIVGNFGGIAHVLYTLVFAIDRRCLRGPPKKKKEKKKPEVAKKEAAKKDDLKK